MLDTLHYQDNRIQLQPTRDGSCSIILTFNERSVEVMKIYRDPTTGCGFAPGVIVPATLHKTSSDIPMIQDLSGHGRSGGG